MNDLLKSILPLLGVAMAYYVANKNLQHNQKKIDQEIKNRIIDLYASEEDIDISSKKFGVIMHNFYDLTGFEANAQCLLLALKKANSPKILEFYRIAPHKVEISGFNSLFKKKEPVNFIEKKSFKINAIFLFLAFSFFALNFYFLTPAMMSYTFNDIDLTKVFIATLFYSIILFPFMVSLKNFHKEIMVKKAVKYLTESTHQ